ncbi:NAD(P)-binding protein [Durotheca rogersii]|uniref:NAD(P)-binding protein n=1 Tax=Durotheca rogersii TaxID=419775 RepID=UPI0022200E32|nr:NAD(P)-binding protein [Durotheca rogersii]KAI5863672.1 NAD(P)-binding protein [Durotheca rogersii]
MLLITGYAFVTGGGSGICKAVCEAFAKSGVDGLLVADINLESATGTAQAVKALATNPNFRAEAVQIDVAKEESVAAATQRMLEVFGRIDYCVNGAGVAGNSARVTDFPLEDFERVMGVNAQGTFIVLKVVLAAMASQEAHVIDPALPARGVTRGAIVNLGSIASHIGISAAVAYVASKHAVLGMTKVAALENAKHNIRVNCLCPSWVATPMINAAMKAKPTLEASILSQSPQGRLALPEEIADIAVFLCSTHANWINGSSYGADGAWLSGFSYSG